MRLLVIGAGCALAAGLATASWAEDEDYDEPGVRYEESDPYGSDTEMRRDVATPTTTTVTVPRQVTSLDEGHPESDWRDERKDVRNLMPHENPLKGLRWAEDIGDTEDDRDRDR